METAMNRFYPKWTGATDAAAGRALQAVHRVTAAATMDRSPVGRWVFFVTVVYIVVTERRRID
jgi:hypothetical protein